jgi:hypothetical protein
MHTNNYINIVLVFYSYAKWTFNQYCRKLKPQQKYNVMMITMVQTFAIQFEFEFSSVFISAPRWVFPRSAEGFSVIGRGVGVGGGGGGGGRGLRSDDELLHRICIHAQIPAHFLGEPVAVAILRLKQQKKKNQVLLIGEKMHIFCYGKHTHSTLPYHFTISPMRSWD